MTEVIIQSTDQTEVIISSGGAPGTQGWSPVVADEAYGDGGIVQRIVNWVGGTGVMPPVGGYIGPDGIVDDPADAVNIATAINEASQAAVAYIQAQAVIAGDAQVARVEETGDEEVARILATGAAVVEQALNIGLFVDLGTKTPPSFMTIITTSGHTVAGLGAAQYVRLPAGTYGATSYRTQTADGAWWQLYAETEVWITQFGAQGLGASFDDYPAIQAAIDWATFAAIRDEYASSYTVKVPLTNAFWRVSQTIILDRNVRLQGACPSGRGSTAVKIQGDDGIGAVLWVRHPGGASAPPSYLPVPATGNWGSGRSIVEHLSFTPRNVGMVDYGIVANNPCELHDLSLQNFRLAGVFFHAQSSGNALFGDPNGTGGSGTMYGNTNGSFINKVWVRDTREGHGFAMSGNNAQIMTFMNCDVSGCSGAGFRDNSAIGNIFINCHSAQCSYKTFVEGTTIGLNGTFATADDWTFGAGWTLGTNQAVSAGGALLTQTLGSLVAAQQYAIRFEVQGYVSGVMRPAIIGATTVTATEMYRFNPDGSLSYQGAVNGNGVYYAIITAPTAPTAYAFNGSPTASVFNGAITDVQIYPITFYSSISQHTASNANKPGTGANWRDNWGTVTASVPDAVWTLGTSYRTTGGINIVETAGNNPAVFAHYSEGGIEIGIVPRGNTALFGGTAVGYGRVLYPTNNSNNVKTFGGTLVDTPPQWRNVGAVSGYAYGSGLGSTRETPLFLAMGHSDDDPVNYTTRVQLNYSVVRHAYEMVHGSTQVWKITGTGWSTDAFSGAGLMFAQNGIVFGPRAIRLRSGVSQAAVSGAVTRGDYYLYFQPTTEGYGGAVVTTGGTVGTDAVVCNFAPIFDTNTAPARSKQVSLTMAAGATTDLNVTMPSGAIVLGYTAETQVAFTGSPTTINLRMGSTVGGAQYVADTDVKAQGWYDLIALYAGRRPATTLRIRITASGGTPADIAGTVIVRILYRV